MEESVASSLSPAQRRELLARARAAAANALGTLSPKISLPNPSGRLLEPGMSFVTWKKDGALRGCIGSIEPVRPIFADVEANAVHALLRDPRFRPATAAELPHLHLEISVLTPFVPEPDPRRRVVIGRHGLLVEKGACRGLLLPQVPVEWGWDVETFLHHACEKAGLRGDSWRDRVAPPAISTFEAEVFGEGEGGTGG